MPKLARVAVLWVPFAGVITILCGMVYLTVQQSLRQSANDPQIQMAEDAAGALARGAAEETVLPATQVDIATSLSPFAISIPGATWLRHPGGFMAETFSCHRG